MGVYVCVSQVKKKNIKKYPDDANVRKASIVAAKEKVLRIAINVK